MDRLTEPNTHGTDYYCWNYCPGKRYAECRASIDLTPCAEWEIYNRLAEYEQAESEGRLIVLPCKVGDTVYWIKGKAILEAYIQWFETNAHGWCACGTYPPMSTPTFRFADFGKTVFRSREEAEAALGGDGDGL